MQIFARILTVLASALVLALAPVGAIAQQYPQTGTPDRGGRLGLEMDTTPYTYGGISVVRVLSIDPDSYLNGSVEPGDYLYGINGFNLRSWEDVFWIASSGSPGYSVRVDYLDAGNNFTPMYVMVPTVSGFGSQVSNPTTIASAPEPNFCEEHPFLCIGGAILALGGLAAAASSGSDSGYGDSGTGAQMCASYGITNPDGTPQYIPC